MNHYVTESLAFMVSSNMDAGSKDYHLEAAVSKVSALPFLKYCIYVFAYNLNSPLNPLVLR